MLDTAKNLSSLEIWTIGFIYFCILYYTIFFFLVEFIIQFLKIQTYPYIKSNIYTSDLILETSSKKYDVIFL